MITRAGVYVCVCLLLPWKPAMSARKWRRCKRNLSAMLQVGDDVHYENDADRCTHQTASTTTYTANGSLNNGKKEKVLCSSFVAATNNGHRVQLLYYFSRTWLWIRLCVALAAVSWLVLIVSPWLRQLAIFMAVDFLEEQINFPRPRTLTNNYTHFNVTISV